MVEAPGRRTVHLEMCTHCLLLLETRRGEELRASTNA
jgi:hypothetical protein